MDAFERVLTFGHRPARALTKPGVLVHVDATIHEARARTEVGAEVCVYLEAHHCTESLAALVDGDAVRIECDLDGDECVGLALAVRPERVDAQLRAGTMRCEEHLVTLVRAVWREARVDDGAPPTLAPPPPADSTPPEDTAPRTPRAPPAPTPAPTPDETTTAWAAEYPLFPHQRRTVDWMREMEACFPLAFAYDGNVHLARGWYIDTEAECVTRDPSRREAVLSGGICADGVGSGKTATLLRLVAETRDAGATDPEATDSNAPDAPDSNELYASNGTLVVVPLNLVSQWQAEVRKFLGERVRTLVLVQGKELRALTMDDLRAADVVITTCHFLRALRPYLELVDAALGGRPRTRAALGAWARQRNHVAPVLEAVRWRRVVVDEVHDALESPRDMRHLKLLRARALWGLTATPNMRDLERAQQLYALLAREKAHHPNLLARTIAMGVRSHTGATGTATERTLRWVRLSAEERARLDEATPGNVAAAVRACTLADASADNAAERRASRLADAHARALRAAELVAADLNAAAAAPDAPRDAVATARAHARDVEALRAAHAQAAARLETARVCAGERDARAARARRAEVEGCAACGAREVGVAARCCGAVFCGSCGAAAKTCPCCAAPWDARGAAVVATVCGARTKMAEIGALLASMGEPAILFVQWRSMVRAARAALADEGVRALTLDGNASQRAATLTTFAVGGVLLLCLEEGFAGLHLPHARHVVFAHAIVGDRDEVRRLETQAIARCARTGACGVTRIHSFLVAETEEENLWFRTH